MHHCQAADGVKSPNPIHGQDCGSVAAWRACARALRRHVWRGRTETADRPPPIGRKKLGKGTGHKPTKEVTDHCAPDTATWFLQWPLGPAAALVGSPRLLTVDRTGPKRLTETVRGRSPRALFVLFFPFLFFVFFRPPPGQGGRQGGFVYPGLTTPAAVCLYWARHPAVHDGLFILGPSPSSAIRGARRAAQNRNNNQGGGSPNTQKEQQKKETQKGGAGSQLLEPQGSP